MTVALPTASEITAALIAREELPPEKGDIGPQGIPGEDGQFGPPGPQGPKGDPGRNGVDGAPGDLGPVGPQGKQGDRGLKGDKGDKGDEGEKGDRGPIGPTGASGTGRSFFPRGGGSSGSGSGWPLTSDVDGAGYDIDNLGGLSQDTLTITGTDSTVDDLANIVVPETYVDDSNYGRIIRAAFASMGISEYIFSLALDRIRFKAAPGEGAGLLQINAADKLASAGLGTFGLNLFDEATGAPFVAFQSDPATIGVFDKAAAPVAQQTIDAPNATPEQIANILIAYGLAVQAP